MVKFVLVKKGKGEKKYFSIISGCMVLSSFNLAYQFEIFLNPVYSSFKELIVKILLSKFSGHTLMFFDINNFRLCPIGKFKSHSERTKDLLILEWFSEPVYRIKDYSDFEKEKYSKLSVHFSKRTGNEDINKFTV